MAEGVTVRQTVEVRCLCCQTKRSLGAATPISETRGHDGRLMTHVDTTAEPAHRIRRIGFRRLTIDSHDPAEYGAALDGYVCPVCHESVLRHALSLRPREGDVR